jgi:putative GTP pyrophosphokinase
MSKKTELPNSHENWLIEEFPNYERLGGAVRSLLENILKKRQIEFLAISHRAKTLSGALEKIRRKDYNNPRVQLTDLSGIRVITYLEEQVDEISKTVRYLFEVDEENSRDRSEILGDDKVGYRSTHFVCTLGQNRDKLPEYESLGALKFEIQVRTVLQHAWAELAHDRSFKFGAALPSKIQRKLNLYSGMLEVVDSNFDEISKEIDAYKQKIEKTSVDKISSVNIDSISVSRLVDDISQQHGIKFIDKNIANFLFPIFHAMGFEKIGDLQQQTSKEMIAAYKNITHPTATGFLRTLIANADLDKYLSIVPPPSSISQNIVDILSQKYGHEKVKSLLRDKKVEILAPFPHPR